MVVELMRFEAQLRSLKPRVQTVGGLVHQSDVAALLLSQLFLLLLLAFHLLLRLVLSDCADADGRHFFLLLASQNLNHFISVFLGDDLLALLP